MTQINKYPKFLIIIHWLTLILLAVIFYVGTTFDEYEFNEINMNRYRLHAILGVSVMVLTIIRAFFKRNNLERMPVEITYYSESHKAFVKIVQKLIYILLIITPMVGFVMVYQTGAISYDFGGPFPIGADFEENLEIMHKIFVFSLLILIVIHVSGIFMYNFKNKDNLIKRMCLLS